MTRHAQRRFWKLPGDRWERLAATSRLLVSLHGESYRFGFTDRLECTLARMRTERNIPKPPGDYFEQFSQLSRLSGRRYEDLDHAIRARLPRMMLAFLGLNDRTGPLLLGKQRWSHVSRYFAKKAAEVPKVSRAPPLLTMTASSPSNKTPAYQRAAIVQVAAVGTCDPLAPTESTMIVPDPQTQEMVDGALHVATLFCDRNRPQSEQLLAKLASDKLNAIGAIMDHGNWDGPEARDKCNHEIADIREQIIYYAVNHPAFMCALRSEVQARFERKWRPGMPHDGAFVGSIALDNADQIIRLKKQEERWYRLPLHVRIPYVRAGGIDPVRLGDKSNYFVPLRMKSARPRP